MSNQKFSNYRKLGEKEKAHLASGHVWKERGGIIDIFAYDDGHHNGPKCTVCGYSVCWHCRPEPAPCTKGE